MNVFRNLLLWLSFLAVAGLFAWAPLSSRALNLAWILLFFLVVCMFVLHGVFGQRKAGRSVLSVAAKTVFLCFSLGLTFKLLGQWYWGVLGEKISFELNAVVAAGVALAICFLPARSARVAFVWFGLAGFSITALWAAVNFSLHGDVALPTNAVNWGAGVALILCVISAWAFSHQPAPWGRYLAVGLALLLVLAVFVSGRRGAFFSILWAIGLGVLGLFRSSVVTFRRPAIWLATGIALVLVSSSIWLSPNLVSSSIDRLLLGVKEASSFVTAAQDERFVPSGSVDTRLYMYKQAVEVLKNHPLEGAGPQKKLDLQVDLFHLHNEYLDAWVAYGILGLLAALILPAGLVIAGWRVRTADPGLAWMLIGVGFSHFTSGLSNVNTFHNYYQTIFAIAVVLPFLLVKTSAAAK